MTPEYFKLPSSYTEIQVVAAQISIHTTQSSFCLFDRTDSGALNKFGYMSYISIPISLTAFLILFNIFRFIEKIFASTSIFLAVIQIGFFTQFSRSTIKFSGITFNISLFGKSTPHFAISKALSMSSSAISPPDTATTHLFLITSYDEELNEIYAHVASSQDIFSASSRDLSKLFLNSSISRIFPFLIAFDSEIHTPSI
jgi:hypothetical protein